MCSGGLDGSGRTPFVWAPESPIDDFEGPSADSEFLCPFPNILAFPLARDGVLLVFECDLSRLYMLSLTLPFASECRLLFFRLTSIGSDF